MDYNVIVIGAGSAGLVSAYLCATLRGKVALVEKNRMGGDCLYTGCVPSKALIRTASVLSQIARHRDFGLSGASVTFDFAEVMDRIHRVIRTIEPHDSRDRYRALGVDCLEGEARLLGPRRVQVGSRIFTTRSIILATGGRPAVPPLPGLDQIRYLHTDNLWEMRTQPKRLVIIGGGPIGAELGQCFARLGTRVIQLQKGSHLLPREDCDAAEVLEERLRREGIDLRLKSSAQRVFVRGARKSIEVESEGTLSEIEFDELLVAVGRKPQTEGLGLEALGIETDVRGAVKVDAYGRTSIKQVFACGDVTSPYQFTHMAAHQAWYCAVNALFQPFKKFKIDASLVPWCTYTEPEIARVGLNESEAKKRNVPYETAVFPLSELDRAITDEEAHGFIKVLTPPGKDKVLGVTLCGYHAGDLLAEFVMAMKHGIGLNKILGLIHVYPTMAEANKYAAGVWRRAHAPKGLLKGLEKFHRLRRIF